MNIIEYLIEMLCKLAESSLQETSIRGNFQKDVRFLKKTVN